MKLNELVKTICLNGEDENKVASAVNELANMLYINVEDIYPEEISINIGRNGKDYVWYVEEGGADHTGAVCIEDTRFVSEIEVIHELCTIDYPVQYVVTAEHIQEFFEDENSAKEYARDLFHDKYIRTEVYKITADLNCFDIDDLYDLDFNWKNYKNAELLTFYDFLNLKKIREEKGLSQSELSDASGVSLRMIQFYEQGAKNIDNAKIETIYKLANALKVPADAILEDEKIKEEIKKNKHRI